MKNLFALIFFVLGILPFGYSYHSNTQDSLGVSTKDGKDYIIHKVEAGETLFALSRKYDVSVQEIKDANVESVSSLNIGQKVLIPHLKKVIDPNATIHTVKSSETLFSISRSYNVQVDELKEWNHLSDNSISVGQELIIKNSDSKPTPTNSNPVIAVGDRKTHEVAEAQTLYSISRMYGVSTDQIKEWNNLSSNNLNIGQVLIVSSVSKPVSVASNSSMLPTEQMEETVVSEPKKEIPEEKATKVVITPVLTPEEENIDKIETPAEKVIQKGMAEVIEDSSDTKKYLALHRDAPIGTIMQVKNEMNNQTVFVRIVGKIPPTGDNGKVILKISKKAYDRLGAVDNRFPVEISFIP